MTVRLAKRMCHCVKALEPWICYDKEMAQRRAGLVSQVRSERAVEPKVKHMKAKCGGKRVFAFGEWKEFGFDQSSWEAEVACSKEPGCEEG